jgi:L-fucose mutarotase
MLKTIDPRIGPELLHALARMGHGDTLALVDRNYPAYAAGAPVVRMDGLDTTEALSVILTLFPLDTFIDEPIARMAVVDDLEREVEVARAALSVAQTAEGRDVGIRVVERLAFYNEAKSCSVVITTSEARQYGCFLLTKGIV